MTNIRYHQMLMIFRIVSIFIFCITILATNISFPFWKIYSPQTGISLSFIFLFIGLPIAILNGFALARASSIIVKNKSRKTEYFTLFILTLGILCFVIGIAHNAYQAIPANNLNLYRQPREYIVNLIKLGKLHGQIRCLQNEVELEKCIEEIELPDKYKGLSRNGKVILSTNLKEISIKFTHSTYNFGDGSIYIVYSSLKNNLSEAKWQISK
ncbi:hypothetical protein H6G80_28345 [Nostoc sp. FACHB-87]|nr:hypothetical protein [Nostoc sp. FACHB-87]MBD2457962.1 hypothetical protein [Nostoc sp. FACHB-87]